MQLGVPRDLETTSSLGSSTTSTAKLRASRVDASIRHKVARRVVIELVTHQEQQSNKSCLTSSCFAFPCFARSVVGAQSVPTCCRAAFRQDPDNCLRDLECFFVRNCSLIVATASSWQFARRLAVRTAAIHSSRLHSGSCGTLGEQNSHCSSEQPQALMWHKLEALNSRLVLLASSAAVTECPGCVDTWHDLLRLPVCAVSYPGYPYGGTAPAPYSTSAAPLVITPGGGYQADGQPPGNWNRGRDRSRSRDEDRGRSRRRRRRRSPTPDPHRQRAPSNSPLPTRPKEKKNKSRSRRRRDDKVEKEERKDLKEEKRAKEEPKKEKKSEPVKEKKAAKEVAPPAESSGKISLKPRKDAPPPTAPREERAEKKNKTEKPPGRAKNSLEMAEDIPEKKTKKEAKPEKSKVKLKEASPPPLPRKEEKASRKATKADKEEMQAKIREEQQKNSKLVTLRERLMQSSIKVAQLQQRLLDKKDDFSDDRGRGYSKAGKGRAAGSKAAPADESVYSESDDAPPPPRGKKCVVLD
eukprot:TRINITY_DN7259_c0_g1_i3.p1 TRINITY_DN7259_c0_g1~~TRINITY_DN7259_c0_g1_i3.p1  ORF type:complete len:525 (-),score=115.75 TRINITY_DN7259_c0_g1_i3:252-1826(-)